MADVIGYRANLAVLVPSTNTVVEAEYVRMAPPGVTVHAGRMYVARPQLHSDESTSDLMEDIRIGAPAAVRDVMTLQPDALLLGMSAPAFYGGLSGCLVHEQQMAELAGGTVPVTSGPRAILRALELIGVQRIAVLSPYQPVNDKEVIGFFEGQGVEIKRYHGLRSETATSIARTPPDLVRGLLQELAASGADAIVQVGTNLAMASMSDEAERWLGIPVLAINAVTLWSALRDLGIEDRIYGYGSILRDH
jgi:maleate isomerase